VVWLFFYTPRNQMKPELAGSQPGRFCRRFFKRVRSVAFGTFKDS
jgi:hypothetical protein